MNAYLQRKCRSEQQLMNELSKLLASKDYASKKMSELLKELGFYYVSPLFVKIPHSVLKDLSVLLTHLKDKKEDLRIAKLVLCFLARIVDVFELRYHHHALTSATSREASRAQSFDMAMSTTSNLMKIMETSELNHASFPRQATCLKLYAHLCRIFQRSDVLMLRIKPMIQKSPVWGLLTADKKVTASITGKKDFLTQIALLGAAFHSIRFHLTTDEQSYHFLENILQAAFLPNAAASRHAAATLLQLFETSNEQAKQVTAQFEVFFARFRPATLRVGDQLATIYLVRLCGQLSRLPITGDSSSGASQTRAASSNLSNLLDFSFDTGDAHGHSASDAPAASPPPSPIQRQRRRVEGITVSSTLSSRLRDLFLDILCAPDVMGGVPKAVLLVTIEEAVKDANAECCILKARGNVSLFEIAASLLLKVLGEAIATQNVATLHRVVRTVQFTAEALDGSVLQMTGTTAHHPQFMDRITDQIITSGLLSHANAFVTCQSLRALVWLLPRASSGVNDKWPMLTQRLRDLPQAQLQPEARQTIAEAFFHRAVTQPSLHQHAVDHEMLGKVMQLTLVWFQTQPCEWHAAMLVRIWTTALRKCLATLGDAVFASINAVLDFQHRTLRIATERVHQSTLLFLSHFGVSHLIQQSSLSWFHALVLRLTKHMLLSASLVTRRLSVNVLAEFHVQASQSGCQEIVSHVQTLVTYLTQPASSSSSSTDVVRASRIHTQEVKDTLGIQDALRQCLALRLPSKAPATVSATSVRNVEPATPFAAAGLNFSSTQQSTSSVLSAFDGMF
ncbi:hypothetical protein Poli38472_006699 [Pythium oligandrum]|uniref:Uncharacterized protein n=1 Tax=Pythium oligandrum TaxID=41045 RepID=A0A8K1C585_PYTOL|nr:hypothetical protein Poli38472_006699 [Pythium oligandrum]|eukprot:TMW56689.1 hypothetical protein Poli38472_006699 [Pythium oligandrum]